MPHWGGDITNIFIMEKNNYYQYINEIHFHERILEEIQYHIWCNNSGISAINI
jgi:hypothetical protein